LRLSVTVSFFWLGSSGLLAQTATQDVRGPIVRGTVTESRSARPLQGVTVQIAFRENLAERLTTLTNEAGRFELRPGRRGAYDLVARSPGFAPFGVSVRVDGDSLAIAINLTPLAQPLPEVSVLESEVELFASEVRRSFRSVGRSRVYDAAQLERTGQLLAGPFLFGQAGIHPVSCGRSSQFLPEGKVRTEPVLKEPADIWYPCYMDRDKPRSIMVRIDGGPAMPFDAISSRVLSEFATMAVIQGGIIVAYTKEYALQQRRRSRSPH
jgi:hypothetical protein